MASSPYAPNTTPVDSLALLLSEPKFPSTVLTIFRVGIATPVETSTAMSAALIAAYAVCAVLIALAYFSRMDISKRVT